MVTMMMPCMWFTHLEGAVAHARLKQVVGYRCILRIPCLRGTYIAHSPRRFPLTSHCRTPICSTTQLTLGSMCPRSEHPSYHCPCHLSQASHSQITAAEASAGSTSVKSSSISATCDGGELPIGPLEQMLILCDSIDGWWGLLAPRSGRLGCQLHYDWERGRRYLGDIVTDAPSSAFTLRRTRNPLTQHTTDCRYPDFPLSSLKLLATSRRTRRPRSTRRRGSRR